MSNNINEIISNNFSIKDDGYEIIDKELWDKIEHNDSIYVEKNDNTINKYYFKSINEKHLTCGNYKFNSNNSKYKCIPFKFLLSNVKNIYRQSKITNNIDLILLNKRIDTLSKIMNNMIIIIDNLSKK